MKLNIPKNEEAKNKPTNYFFITDLSGSMWGSIPDLKETLRAVKDLLVPGDTFSLAYFSSSGDFDWICKGANIGGNLEALIESKIYARGLTCFTEVLNSLENVVNDVQLISGNTENVLFFLTDGYPNDRSPESEVLRVCKSLKKSFIHKQIVGYSGYYNRKLLLQMTEDIGGAFAHVSDYSDMKKSCKDFVSNKKKVKKINLPKNYELVWQVSSKEVLPLVSENSNVEVLESDEDNELFAIDYNELDSLTAEQLKDGRFVYSLALMLSQKNKANLGVSLLRKAGDKTSAKILQKSFTVNQKGRAENDLKVKAIIGGEIVPAESEDTVFIGDFLKKIKENLGSVYIDMNKSQYTSISRKGGDASKVEFKTTDTKPTIVGITGNEDRANISFLTVRKGQVTGIYNDELSQKVEDYNKTASNPIVFPIESSTYRNYTLVANGDFNFDSLSLFSGDKEYSISPSKDIDLFDEKNSTIHIKDFVNLNKSLLEEKAHASVLRFYIKKHATQKHSVDLRVEGYGEEGAKLLEEMGFDYQMRYSPKKEYKPKDENADYIPFLEISGQLKGAATISASKSYEKWTKKGKANVGDLIVFPLFEKYEKKLSSLGTETFVEFCQKTLEGVEETVDLLSQKISAQKFYLMVTNSWFEGVDKSDEFEYDGLVVKVKETKEYL